LNALRIQSFFPRIEAMVHACMCTYYVYI
jgi:hypothetical protein